MQDYDNATEDNQYGQSGTGKDLALLSLAPDQDKKHEKS